MTDVPPALMTRPLAASGSEASLLSVLPETDNVSAPALFCTTTLSPDALLIVLAEMFPVPVSPLMLRFASDASSPLFCKVD